MWICYILTESFIIKTLATYMYMCVSDVHFTHYTQPLPTTVEVPTELGHVRIEKPNLIYWRICKDMILRFKIIQVI